MQPLGAPSVLFFWVAVPAILAMAVWAGVMAYRILQPDAAAPRDGSARGPRATDRGGPRPVRLRDILDDERARQAARPRETVAKGGPPAPPSARSALAEDLWRRRN